MGRLIVALLVGFVAAFAAILLVVIMGNEISKESHVTGGTLTT